ncbi:glutaminyl-peptide cyclotransferase [Oceanicoccus sp. KOV_DT_Chl]|uniref:glutaminyl-peptide cyclotransferase n=1 Tax=Oceanicoccus sp. KOV_DT_Chl TaxID=1904639 RepID=UPI000C7C37B3|nr:glutaminyl-peptide cyclotransferase [Oceanicoccus sp. KOV_DT_Chl]
MSVYNVQQHSLTFLSWRYRKLILFLLCSTIISFAAASQAAIIDYHYTVISEHPHDPAVFTQGLVFHKGLLYEGSGIRGQSKVFSRSLNDAHAITLHANAPHIFGEGITIIGDKLYQLSWQSQQGFIYRVEDLTPVATFTINGEGWGLTHNQQHLIVSNGSNLLQFINPNTFAVEKTLAVTLAGKPLHKLNELEWVEGLIYANVWQSNWIVMIDPESGEVVAKVRLHQLLPRQKRTNNTNVLNGIAYDASTKRLWVTGKNWPSLFQIQLHRSPESNTSPHAQTPVR